MLIADYLASVVVDPAFLDPEHQSSALLWAGMYAYAVQIFCDFSGYTDMAIGIAALFGYRFPLNFNQPYRATSLRDFWSRWHISLSSWLRDYLYIPLGGSRRGQARTCLNLLTTMAIGGLWHGASWTFVLWGVLHGVALALGRMMSWRTPRIVGWAITFHIVCLGWVLFRAPDFATAIAYIGGLVRFDGGAAEVNRFAAAITAACIASQFLPPNALHLLSRTAGPLPWSILAAATAAACVLIAAFGPDGVPPFIYFAF